MIRKFSAFLSSSHLQTGNFWYSKNMPPLYKITNLQPRYSFKSSAFLLCVHERCKVAAACVPLTAKPVVAEKAEKCFIAPNTHFHFVFAGVFFTFSLSATAPRTSARVWVYNTQIYFLFGRRIYTWKVAKRSNSEAEHNRVFWHLRLQKTENAAAQEARVERQ